ncbi:hypothetical protein C9925_01770, partial [cyanobacterium G8-9]
MEDRKASLLDRGCIKLRVLFALIQLNLTKNGKNNMNQKLKQLLIALTVLSTYTHASCSKQEVMKLIDKGF